MKWATSHIKTQLGSVGAAFLTSLKIAKGDATPLPTMYTIFIQESAIGGWGQGAFVYWP